MLENAGFLRAKTSQEFRCEKCDYVTSKIGNWKRHVKTKRHKMLDNAGRKLWICECGREYKHNQSYYRHRKKCEFVKTCINSADQTQSVLHAKVIELLEDNIELHKDKVADLEARNITLQEDKADLRAQQAELADLVRATRAPITNNFNNCVILLNALCPSAISINEFSASLRLTSEDFTHTIDNGYIAGVSNAFIKRLRGIDPSLRPIQCSDSKGKDIYVKDEGTWSKDGGAVLGDHISTVSKQQLEALKVWEKEHPAWRNSERETNKYIELVGELMGGSSNEERSKNHQLIQERIGQTCNIADVVTQD